MSNDSAAHFVVLDSTWVEPFGSGVQVYQASHRQVDITCERPGVLQLPALKDPDGPFLTPWFVRRVGGQPSQEDDPLDRGIILPPRAELPELVYIAGGSEGPVRMFYPTATRDRREDSLPWADVIGDRDLSMLETLCKVTLARIEEVRRGDRG